MADNNGNIKIIISIPPNDLRNYPYSKKTDDKEMKKKPSSRFVFPKTTCFPSGSILLEEEN